jgi:hypothetical protein
MLFLGNIQVSRMPQLHLVLQIATATLLLLVCILLARHSRSGLNSWAGIGFAISIFCYLIVESHAIRTIPLLRIGISIGAISIPILFWLLSRAIFQDHFRFRASLLIWFLILLIGSSQSKTPMGVWNTIDDTWDKVKSEVEIVEKNANCSDTSEKSISIS